jgi:hydroxyacylglutathione hydrolase
MAFDLRALPAFQDNYIWLLVGRNATAIAVDPGDAAPVRQALTASRLSLEAVLVTHHHADHMGGAAELAEMDGCPVYGPATEHIPAVTHPLRQGDPVTLPGIGARFQVLDIPGHTAGHIAYHGHGILFCGDTLFSVGCGRLFEGTAQQMCASLAKLAALGDDLAVCCGHEYTLANLRFAAEVEPDNAERQIYARECAARRARGEATLPSRLGLERRINPFLRCDAATVVTAASRHAGRKLVDPVEVFAVIRDWKNGFS